jgi:histidine triad (HIT) family protein
MSFALPVRRLRETDTLIAFYHPLPSYPTHILLVPKKALASLANLTLQDQDFLVDLAACTQSLVNDLGLQDSGYSLSVNSGGYQEAPQLHFHLVSEKEPRFRGTVSHRFETNPTLYRHNNIPHSLDHRTVTHRGSCPSAPSDPPAFWCHKQY